MSKTNEARRNYLSLARYAAETGRTRSGAMRQIVRYLRELDTPEVNIRAATGLTAGQLDMLVADDERKGPPTGPRNASVQALLALGSIHEAQEGLADQLVAAVAQARAVDCSWEMIGAMLGISRQAAQERFGRRVA
jgi:hypothetical protein